MKYQAEYMKNSNSWITPTFAHVEVDGWKIEVTKNNVPEQPSDDPVLDDGPEWYRSVVKPDGWSVATWNYPDWVIRICDAMETALSAAPEYKNIYKPGTFEFEA